MHDLADLAAMVRTMREDMQRDIPNGRRKCFAFGVMVGDHFVRAALAENDAPLHRAGRDCSRAIVQRPCGPHFTWRRSTRHPRSPNLFGGEKVRKYRQAARACRAQQHPQRTAVGPFHV